MGTRFKVPHTLVLLYGMVVLAYALTWILPAGSFETELSHGHEIVVPGTYTATPEVEPQPWWSLLTVIPRGLEAGQGIIFFIFI